MPQRLMFTCIVVRSARSIHGVSEKPSNQLNGSHDNHGECKIHPPRTGQWNTTGSLSASTHAGTDWSDNRTSWSKDPLFR
jgi:hypothetical protein